MSDPMVLAAQIWLNATYGGVTGYVPCQQDGATGGATISSIIMGLQHELGINPVVPNLGPTTWNFMQTYGTITAAGTNVNIVKLLQCSMYCKGYDGDALSGTWTDGRLALGLNTLQRDIGYSASQLTGTASPKLFRALLNTDAFTLVPGGSPAIRAAQQWLNLTYIARQNFFFAPSDGFFSRGGQKALVLALQFELGQSDAQADGAYGPGTANLLKASAASVVSIGSSDSTAHWVKLFKAALAFNRYTVPFDSTFTQADSAVVLRFQLASAFVPADRTGKGDYRTWAELLVSTGDPTRPGTAADAASTITSARAVVLKNAGYTTVGRYLTNAPQLGALDKNIKPGELTTIFNSGLRVFPIFEENGDSKSGITYLQGTKDMSRATVAALAYGFWPNTTIYYAVDFDATAADIATNVIPYFRGLRDAKGLAGSPYGIGIYGSRNVCAQVLNAGLSIATFVGGLSTGYSGNLGFPLPAIWSFNQIQGVTLGSGTPGQIDIDKDVQSGADSGQASINPTPVPPDNDPNANFFKMLSWLQIRAQNYFDMTAGSPNPELLVAQYCRGTRYDGAQWTLFAGERNPGFLAYVAAQLSSAGLSFPVDYIEPSVNQRYDIYHLFATLNAYLFAGTPASQEDPVTIELAGWAGDLTTTLADFAVHGAGVSISDFAHTYIANNSAPYSFGLADFNQDVDAYNIAAKFVLGTGASIPDLVKEVLVKVGGSYPGRYSKFFATRFNSNVSLASTAAGRVFLMPGDTPARSGFNLARSALLASYGNGLTNVSNYTSAQLQALGTAFVDKLTTL